MGAIEQKNQQLFIFKNNWKRRGICCSWTTPHQKSSFQGLFMTEIRRHSTPSTTDGILVQFINNWVASNNILFKTISAWTIMLYKEKKTAKPYLQLWIWTASHPLSKVVNKYVQRMNLTYYSGQYRSPNNSMTRSSRTSVIEPGPWAPSHIRFV